MPIRIAALLTCHNRREKTVACLRALRAQILPGWNPGEESEKRKAKSEKQEHVTGVTTKNEEPKKPASSPLSAEGPDVSTFNFPLSTFSLEVFLVDDGCTDGTADAVREIWPEAKVLHGDGKLFWCGGMRVAWQAAAQSDPDFYLLLNDDTIIYPEAVNTLLDMAGGPESRIIVPGAVADPSTGEWTYGGVQSEYLFPMANGKPRPCGSLNMNVALVPRAVYRELGVLHHEFRHAMGDIDYGLQARRKGIDILETPNIIGECEDNPIEGTWRDTSIGRVNRFKKLSGAKGLPIRDWYAYTRRNCGSSWLRYFLSPYFRVLLGR